VFYFRDFVLNSLLDFGELNHSRIDQTATRLTASWFVVEC